MGRVVRRERQREKEGCMILIVASIGNNRGVMMDGRCRKRSAG
jgi:hypothetical protein